LVVLGVLYGPLQQQMHWGGGGGIDLFVLDCTSSRYALSSSEPPPRMLMRPGLWCLGRTLILLTKRRLTNSPKELFVSPSPSVSPEKANLNPPDTEKTTTSRQPAKNGARAPFISDKHTPEVADWNWNWTGLYDYMRINFF